MSPHEYFCHACKIDHDIVLEIPPTFLVGCNPSSVTFVAALHLQRKEVVGDVEGLGL